MSSEPSRKDNIIFFDGVCSLCNGFIDFLIKRDHQKKFRYASLQGEAAKAQLRMSRLHDFQDNRFTTIVYLREEIPFERSQAVIKILTDLGGIWSLTRLLLIIPTVVRDLIYDWVSKNRYRLFGRRETCRVPSKEERKLFLD